MNATERISCGSTLPSQPKSAPAGSSRSRLIPCKTIRVLWNVSPLKNLVWPSPTRPSFISILLAGKNSLLAVAVTASARLRSLQKALRPQISGSIAFPVIPACLRGLFLLLILQFVQSPASGAAEPIEPLLQSPQRIDPLIARIVSEISQERVGEILQKLESFETRNTLSDPGQTNRGIGLARQWIFDQFKSYSPRLQVHFDTHIIPKRGRVWIEVELRNVVAILPGKMPCATNRWIMVAGHYDSLNLKVPPELRAHPELAAELAAPGVCDDGSG